MKELFLRELKMIYGQLVAYVIVLSLIMCAAMIMLSAYIFLPAIYIKSYTNINEEISVNVSTLGVYVNNIKDIDVSNIIVQANVPRLTYDVEIEHQENLIYIEDYMSGRCLYMTDFLNQAFREIVEENNFIGTLWSTEDNESDNIWLDRKLAQELNGEVGNTVYVDGLAFYIKGIYNSENHTDIPTFILPWNKIKNSDSMEIKAFIKLDENILHFYNSLEKKGIHIDDPYGFKQIFKGLQAIKYSMLILCVLLFSIIGLLFHNLLSILLQNRTRHIAVMISLGETAFKMSVIYIFVVGLVLGIALIISTVATLILNGILSDMIYGILYVQERIGLLWYIPLMLLAYISIISVCLMYATKKKINKLPIIELLKRDCL